MLLATENHQQKFTKSDTNFHHNKFTSKVLHGYFNGTIEKDQKIDQKTSKSWTKIRKLTSHFEGYIATIKEQEIPAKYLIKKELEMQERSHGVIINAVYVKQMLKIL